MEQQKSTSLGVFNTVQRHWDYWFAACDNANGVHRDLVIRPYDGEADHVLIMGNLLPEFGGPKLPYHIKKAEKLRKRVEPRKIEYIIEQLGRDRDSISILVYEPREMYSDEWFEAANAVCDRVYAPDDRASCPITLPVTWSFPEPARLLRDEQPCDDRPIDLAFITSGKLDWKGHAPRLEFVRLLRKAGVRVALYGRGLPADLMAHPDTHGPVESKASILRSAKLTLAIENDATNDRYITEKIWDALLCWSLPLYFGSRAVDSMIPEDSFIRLPDLSDAGVQVVREAIAQRDLWEQRLGAMAQARQLALGDLRITEWAWRTLPR